MPIINDGYEYVPEYLPYIRGERAWMGLSLSGCVEDILDGTMERGSVVAMNTTTCIPDLTSVKEVCKSYSERSDYSYDQWLDTTMYLILNTKFFQYRIWEPQLEQIGLKFKHLHNGNYKKWLPVNRAAFVGLYAMRCQPDLIMSVIPEEENDA